MRMQMLVIGSVVCVVFGCVQRSVKITTSAPKALVWLNDREVGRTPVTVPFHWYGDYDVVIRKKGFQTLKGHRRLKPPWYQVPPFDFVAELLIPTTIYDEHSWHFELTGEQAVGEQDLIDRAVAIRAEAGGEQSGEADSGQAEKVESKDGDN